MSDSGFSSLPPTPQSGEARAPNSTRPALKDAEVLKLPEDTRPEARRIRLPGKVVRVSDSGDVRIQTPKGTVEVRTSDNSRVPLSEGQIVDIDIKNEERPRADVRVHNTQGTHDDSFEARHGKPASKDRIDNQRETTAIKQTQERNRYADTAVDVRVQQRNMQPTNQADRTKSHLELSIIPKGTHLTVTPVTPDHVVTTKANVIQVHANLPQTGITANVEAFSTVENNTSFAHSTSTGSARNITLNPISQAGSQSGLFYSPTQSQITFSKATAAIDNIASEAENVAKSMEVDIAAPALKVGGFASKIGSFFSSPFQINDIAFTMQNSGISTAHSVYIDHSATISSQGIATSKIIQPLQSIQNIASPYSAIASLPPSSSETTLTAPITALSSSLPLFTEIVIEHISLPTVSLSGENMQIPTSPSYEQQAAIMPRSDIFLHAKTSHSVHGIIAGQSAEGGLPVLRFAIPNGSDVRMAAMSLPDDLIPQGARVEFHPSVSTNLSAGSTLPINFAPLIPAIFLTPGLWPSLQDLHQNLQTIAPQLAQAMTALSPAPAKSPAQMPATALFFLAALKSGDMGGWLGDRASDVLKRFGKGDMLTRLSQEGALLSRSSAEITPQDWRALALPFFHEGEYNKAILYFRQEHSKDNGGSDQKQTRFVFDLSLSAMGAVQVDGLFRPEGDRGRLDVILRTHQPLSQHMTQDMRNVYAKGLKSAGIGGELSFQNSPEQWVKVSVKNEGMGVSI